MRVLFSHPTGNANARAVLRALSEEGLLARFHTTIAAPPGRWAEILGAGQTAKLDQRRFPETRWSDTTLHPTREFVRQIAKRMGWHWIVRHEAGWASVDAVYRSLDLAVADEIRLSPDIHAVYAYEDGALRSFRTANEQGVACLYDLPIAHWRRLQDLLRDEAERLPDWAPTMEGLRDSELKHAAKDEELERADRVLVASSFTYESLKGIVDPGKVEIIRYGCLPPTSGPVATRLPGEPIRLLFVGQLTQRKGVADLVDCLSLLNVDYRITLVGPLPHHIPHKLARLLRDPRCHWKGVVPHGRVFEIMAESHIFVFPSIVEGFGMVITESMRSGCPVITTSHTAGPDVLEHGRSGHIVPIRAPEALAAAITEWADDETLRQSVAVAARERARALTWKAYENQTVRMVRAMIEARVAGR